jgi:hypothetical protein
VRACDSFEWYKSKLPQVNLCRLAFSFEQGLMLHIRAEYTCKAIQNVYQLYSLTLVEPFDVVHVHVPGHQHH